MFKLIIRFAALAIVTGFSMPALGRDDSMRALACDAPDQEIQLLSRPQPVYPLVAALLCQQGRVSVEFRVRPDGTTDRIEVTVSEPAGVFDAAATQAISSWFFRPRCQAGEAIGRRATQTIEFKLPPAAANDCPEIDDPEVLALLAELATHYSLLAERIVQAPEQVPDWSRPSLQFSGDLGQIESLHYDRIERQLAERQAILEQDWSLAALGASQIAADPQLRETRRILASWRARMEAEVERFATELERQTSEAQTLADQVDVEPEVWQTLVARFQADPDSAAEDVARMRRQVDQTLAKSTELIEFLDRHRDHWQPLPEQPWLPMFENPALAEQERALRQQAIDSAEQLAAPELESLLMWSNPVL